MLSSSANAYGFDLNIAAVANLEIPTRIPGGTELLRLVDAVISGESSAIRSAQASVINILNPESMVDAAAVFGNFEMMNRVAEGSGIPVAAQAVERMSSTVEALGLRDFLKS